MKKIDLGQTITILANLGVIAGIVFLVIELGQNNELMQDQARQGEELALGEETLMRAYRRRVLASWEWQFGEYDRDRLALEDLPIGGWRATFAGETLIVGLSNEWEQWREQTTPEFAAFMQEYVIEPGPP